MIERQLFERDVGDTPLLTLPVRKKRCALNARDLGRFFNNLDDDHLLEAIDLLGDLTHLLQGIVRLAVVVVAIRRKQHLGFHLPKPIHNSLKAKVRRARCPNSTQARRCQHGDDGFSNIGHETCHSITWLDTARLQSSGNGSHLRIELVEGGLFACAIFKQ